jgi:triosephosphate isomerase
VEGIINGEDIDGVGAGSGSLNIQDFLKIAGSCSNYLQSPAASIFRTF